MSKSKSKKSKTKTTPCGCFSLGLKLMESLGVGEVTHYVAGSEVEAYIEDAINLAINDEFLRPDSSCTVSFSGLEAPVILASSSGRVVYAETSTSFERRLHRAEGERQYQEYLRVARENRYVRQALGVSTRPVRVALTRMSDHVKFQLLNEVRCGRGSQGGVLNHGVMTLSAKRLVDILGPSTEWFLSLPGGTTVELLTDLSALGYDPCDYVVVDQVGSSESTISVDG